MARATQRRRRAVCWTMSRRPRRCPRRHGSRLCAGRGGAGRPGGHRPLGRLAEPGTRSGRAGGSGRQRPAAAGPLATPRCRPSRCSCASTACCRRRPCSAWPGLRGPNGVRFLVPVAGPRAAGRSRRAGAHRRRRPAHRRAELRAARPPPTPPPRPRHWRTCMPRAACCRRPTPRLPTPTATRVEDIVRDLQAGGTGAGRLHRRAGVAQQRTLARTHRARAGPARAPCFCSGPAPPPNRPGVDFEWRLMLRGPRAGRHRRRAAGPRPAWPRCHPNWPIWPQPKCGWRDSTRRCPDRRMAQGGKNLDIECLRAIAIADDAVPAHRSAAAVEGQRLLGRARPIWTSGPASTCSSASRASSSRAR